MDLDDRIFHYKILSKKFLCLFFAYINQDREFKILQDFSHAIRARAAPPLPKGKNRLQPPKVIQLKTTEKPLSLEDAKNFKTKIKSLLDMEYKALELEIKYFLTYLKDLISAKKKESAEMERQEKNMPKTFYDYVHNPPDSVYIFIAVCIIVIFLLCIGIYILHLVWKQFRRKKRARDVEYEIAKDGKFGTEVAGRFSGLKNKVSNIFKRKKGEERSEKPSGKLERKETLEDVILRTSGYESNSDHDLDELDLRAKLLRTGESMRIDQRLLKDRFR
ncbi:hypothetical protein HNY73_017053 [Argiope bruennichi]|uniref:Uncharacterized protein n=1 Tax=Argiope bruennichi TaxID=94029 RepID=A0A8T0ELW3_ARGBR|nr:hypothetical protein HNY73_017053 [Argiope bruennichi]